MEGIYETNQTFPFDKLVLTKPTLVTGGNYFIKFRINDSPLYIQSPKCQTKQGISKAGKRFFCDLLFTNENEQFIQWMESLESFSQKYIYDHREQWFETELDQHDIENSFSPSLKLYKSGKYYTVRSYVPTILGKCVLKIYDERENEIDYETITDNANVITILELQGIKCSARSFQIEIEMKQMLLLKPTNLFEKCILIPSKNTNTLPEIKTNDNFQNVENAETKPLELFSNNLILESKVLESSDNNSEYLEETKTSEIVLPENTNNEQPVETVCEPESQQEPEENNESMISLEPSNEICEFDLHLEELPENEIIQLKTRNDVYYKMYRDARRKAKIARDLALSSYLEAKRIKNTYMLEDLEDSDSDLEEESFENMENESSA